MLVITRREGEEVVIGDPTAPLGVVRIAAIKGDRVRIAFEFPREIDVHRREVAEQIIDGEDIGQSPVASNTLTSKHRTLKHPNIGAAGASQGECAKDRKASIVSVEFARQT